MRKIFLPLATLALLAACGTEADEGFETDEAELRRSKICPMIYDPVCGRDGVTYSNACAAGPRGRIAHDGPCVDPCALVRCAAGTTCQANGAFAECVATQDPVDAHADDPCATVRCASGTVCQVVQIMCITTPCNPIAECVPAPCTVEECGPAPMMPNTLCADGVNVSGPGKCSRQADGACGWDILTCPL